MRMYLHDMGHDSDIVSASITYIRDDHLIQYVYVCQ